MLAPLALAFLSKPDLEIGLRPLKPVVQIGEQVRFVAPTKNVGLTTIRLVPQKDSMQQGRKFPLCQLQYRSVGDAQWRTPTMPPGCGNTNPAREADFVELRPGETLDLLGGMEWSVHEVSLFTVTPGFYDFRLVYDTSAPIESWLGGPLVPEEQDKALKALFPLYSQVPRGRFVSQTARVRLVRQP